MAGPWALGIMDLHGPHGRPGHSDITSDNIGVMCDVTIAKSTEGHSDITSDNIGV
jgi:hypothetical protein